MMQQLGLGYVGRFNHRHGRAGTLWEGRYKACLVASESHLLRCMRYIDHNPVCARITDEPECYPWSSAAAGLGQRADFLLTPHASYLALGPTDIERAAAYRQLLSEAIPAEELDAIRGYLQQQRAWGSDDFRAMVEVKTRRFSGVRPAYRPGRSTIEQK